MPTTIAQRETIAFGLELEAAVVEVGALVEVAYAQEAARTTVDTVGDFLPRFHLEAYGITLQAMANATIFTAEHVNKLLATFVPIPEVEANEAAEASSQMLRALLARYQSGLAVEAQRQQLLGRGEEQYAEHLLADIQGQLPEHAVSLFTPARNAYVQESRNAVNVQTSVVKYSMLAAAPEPPDA